jgi:hypothetical protein
VIHPSSVAVSRGTSTSKDRSAGHRTAQAGIPGVAAWGTGHCSMVRVPRSRDVEPAIARGRRAIQV